MRIAIVFFALGVLACQQLAELPPLSPLVGLGGAGMVCFAGLLIGRRVPRVGTPVCLIAAGLTGFFWAAHRAELRLADQLPLDNELRDIRVTGVVSSLPQPFERGVRFEFDVERAEAKVPSRIQLAWYRLGQPESGEGPYGGQPVNAGERWTFTVRLKRPHGSLNPFGFDYEAWLFERGIRATGYVRPAEDNRRVDALVQRPAYAVERLREAVRARMQAALADAPYAGILVALVVGDQRAIESGLWQVFSRTGTTHLMSISGLHVTMVASLAFGVFAWGWRRTPFLALRLPAQKAAVLAGAVAALLYALLAGFGVPAQRTCYMLAVVGVALWLGRTSAPSRLLALALLLVLVIDPWAVLSAGFWLSFGAVALLFYIAAARVGRGHWLREWGRAQWAVTIGSAPALLAMFQQLSLVSPLANAVAIPLVSFVITPLAMLGALLPFPALLQLDHRLLDGLMALLIRLSQPTWAVWQAPAPGLGALLLACAGMLWLLLPRGFPARGLGAVLLLPVVFQQPPRPAEGQLRMTVLDVGQGLAVHLQTRAHDLIYDAGPRYSPDADSGNRVILPYLRAMGVTRLDGLVVSHEDNDHSGGARSVIEALPVDWVASSLPPDHSLSRARGHRRCIAGQSWEWDGVHFEMLHPQEQDYERRRRNNDLGCVLRASAGGPSALLAADMEVATEADLTRQRAAEDLRSDVLVVPHHGSRSSSSAEFVRAVSPRWAVFPVGYRNRFRHPHAEVVQRYEQAGAGVLRSDRDGAVTLQLAPGGVTSRLERVERRRYWHGQ